MSVIFPNKWIGRRKKTEASVVLRRQVPIRFDEPARSWLGGLPQMPDNIRWPRTASNGAPLHFIAQIACADLPKQIWNGRGPRDGWLLLFVDVLQMEDSSEEWENCDDLSDFFWLACRRAAGLLGFGGGGLVQVLHINRLGPERQPPEGMTTVRHAMGDYIGRFEPMVREGVPKLWRRWPVDLVVQEIPLSPSEDSGIKWEPLQITGADLYGAPEDDERIDRFTDPELRPLTWRGALYLVDGIRDTLAKQAFDGLLTAPSPEPGWLAAKIAKTETDIPSIEADAAATVAHLQNPPSDMTPEQRAWCERHIVSQRKAAALERRNLADLSVFSRPGGEAALGAEMEQTSAAHLKWRAEQPQVLDSLRTRILGKNLEAPLGVDWSVLKANLTASPTEYWNNWTYTERKVRRSLLDYGENCLAMVLREDVLDLYSRDAAARAVIPPAILAEIEPKLRNIGISRAPHRMGGPRDVVQGYASRTDDDLLFQIFSDDAMGWMWGDLGALFVYLKPFNLKVRRFKRVYAWIDGH
jgi:Domain of unknown function (DUF1963)